MKIPKWLLSKWFYYAMVYVSLLFLFFMKLPSAIRGDDLSANFVAETLGLFFTLIIFYIIFDLRETLQWKPIEDIVKNRIAYQIRFIFTELSNLCEVDRVLKGDKIFDNKAWEELSLKQLNELTSKEISLNDVAREFVEDTEKRLHLAMLFDSMRTYLSEIEGKYFRFLDSELLEALMKVQDHLLKLRLELRIRRAKKEEFFNTITDLIGKTMKEIQEIRHKIDIGF